jgi:hypothetical protein
MIFLGEIHVFLQISWIGQFGTNRAYIHLGKLQLLEVFLWKTNSSFTGYSVLDAAASNIDCFLIRDTCISSLSWIGVFGTKWVIATLKNLICRKYSLEQLSQFSQGKIVLDATASNTNGLLLRYIYMFHWLRWIRLFVSKTAYLHLEIPSCRKFSFQKLTQFSQGNNVLDVAASNTDAFLWRDTCFFSAAE